MTSLPHSDRVLSKNHQVSGYSLSWNGRLTADYKLEPPGPSSLPPLPPVPLPPTSYRRTSIHSTSSVSPKPEIKPSIPSSSPFALASGLNECLDSFRSYGFEVDARYGDTALWAKMGDTRAWIILRHSHSLPVGVRSVRIYAETEGVSSCLLTMNGC